MYEGKEKKKREKYEYDDTLRKYFEILKTNQMNDGW